MNNNAAGPQNVMIVFKAKSNQLYFHNKQLEQSLESKGQTNE